MRCCVAEQRMFRASSSSVLFHFMLLLGLLMAAVTLGFSFHLQNIEPDITMCVSYCNFYVILYLLAENILSTKNKVVIFWFSLLLISPMRLMCFPSRSSCGPFQNGKTVFIVTKVCVESLPSPAPATLSYLSSEAFALPLILAEM